MLFVSSSASRNVSLILLHLFSTLCRLIDDDEDDDDDGLQILENI